VSRYVTLPCSGCYSAGEYGGSEHNYPYDGCRLGAGCHECGYTGKRRTYFAMPDMRTP